MVKFRKQSMIEEKEKAKSQAKILVDLIFAKNLSHALKVACRLGDPFSLSEFYQSLTQDVFEELVKRRKLEKL